MIKNTFFLLLCFLLIVPPVFAQSNLAEPGTTTYKKAKELIIPEVNFNDLSLSEVIAFFQKQSAQADPDKNGLNFVLKNSPVGQEPSVTMKLKNVPLSELLKYVSSMTGYQIKFEEQAIFVIAPEPVSKSKAGN